MMLGEESESADYWEKAGVVTLEDVKAHNLAWAKAPLRDISGERKVVNSRRGKSRSAPDKYEDFYL